MTLVKLLTKLPPGAFLDGELLFESTLPGEVRFLLFASAIAALWYVYRSVEKRVSRKAYRWLLGLRIAVLAILFFILGLPALRTTNPDDHAVFTAVLLDSSRSMSIADAEGIEAELSRFDAAKSVLDGGDDGTGLLSELEGRTSTVLYRFDQHATRVAAPGDATPTGSTTNLFRCVREMESELRALPLASVVMLTDGCSNEGGSAEDAAKLLQARGIPLHIAGFGNEPPPRDYEVVRVVAPRRVRRNTDVEVLVTVRHTDLTDPFDLRLLRGETLLATQQIVPTQDSDLKRVRVNFTPDHDGTAVYRVEIPLAEGESVTENNVREFSIDIQDDRLPVLYVEGSPRKEYRFLRRALFRDPNFRVVGLLRLGNDRFYVQGANENEVHLTGGFPRTRDELFRFQAVILGDIEASYFTGEQLEMLDEFVRDRGGGLLMLGGVNSFGHGGYAKTPVGALLPVRISPVDAPYSDEHYAPKLTEDGLDHPVMQLVPDDEENRRMWSTMPRLIGITPVRGVKPGARLLIVDQKEDRPVLAVQKYGGGRVAAFTSGGSWYWQVSMQASNEFHEKFWKQLVRWLVLGARDHLTAETDADTYARQSPVTIRSTVLHRDLRPNNDADVVATVIDPLGNGEDVPMDWILSEEGVYECRYIPEEEGNYDVKVTVSGMEAEPAATGFLVAEPFVEFSNAGLKRDLLKGMAEMTNGRYVEYPDVAELADAVREDARRAQLAGAVGTKQPIWDMPLLYILLLGLMTAEWIVRRRTGLA